MMLARTLRVGAGPCALAAGLAIASASGSAHAGLMMMSFDLNSVMVEAEDGFDGVTDSGTLVLTQDSNSEIVDLRVNGAHQAMSSTLALLDGTIELENGAVVSGGLSVRLEDGSLYETTITRDDGRVAFSVAEGFTVDGETRGGLFDNLHSGLAFGGVDVSPWLGRGELFGSFFLFAFDPNSEGFDRNANLEIYLFVPSPGAGALGLAGLAVGAIRRRR